VAALNARARDDRVAAGQVAATGVLAAGGVDVGIGDRVVTRRADVRVEADVEALVAAALARFGELHVVFANAGIGSMSPIVDADPAEWMRVIEVNLLGPLLTVKHAAPHLGDGGSIILTASLNAVQPAAGMSAYCCSKAALAMLAEVAAMELGPAGIRVNAIGPGLVRTPLTEGMWLMPAVVGDFDDNAPLATTTSADDVAELVTFLASGRSASISGTLQLIDRAAHTQRYPRVLDHLARALPATPPLTQTGRRGDTDGA